MLYKLHITDNVSVLNAYAYESESEIKSEIKSIIKQDSSNIVATR